METYWEKKNKTNNWTLNILFFSDYSMDRKILGSNILMAPVNIMKQYRESDNETVCNEEKKRQVLLAQ